MFVGWYHGVIYISSHVFVHKPLVEIRSQEILYIMSVIGNEMI